MTQLSGKERFFASPGISVAAFIGGGILGDAAFDHFLVKVGPQEIIQNASFLIHSALHGQIYLTGIEQQFILNVGPFVPAGFIGYAAIKPLIARAVLHQKGYDRMNASKGKIF